MTGFTAGLRQRRALFFLAALACVFLAPLSAGADAIATIDRVRGSIVAIGTLERARTPQFQFRGTGFVVGDGTLIATNAHVLPGVLDPTTLEVLAIMIPAAGGERARFREAKQVAIDPGSDLALLKVGGDKLAPLRLRDSDGVKAGQMILFTGFPIGAALGPYPATHRGMVAAVTPVAIPQASSAELDPHVIRRLTSGAFPVFQLDATAYPGNSGSPIYDPESGEVLGIVNMVFVKGTKEAALTQPSGISYAVPSKHLRNLLEKAR
jgi:serine protease Do